MYKTPREAEMFCRELRERLGDFQDREVAVCPPFPALPAVREALSGSRIQLGAQDAHFADEGAYTGNVSAPMLKEVGASVVILGHSERRQYERETDDLINRKLKNVLRHGLRAICCVGERLEERESGRTEKVVETQLQGVFEGISLADLEQVVIAYEPVWAIGTGKNATPEQAEAVHRFIRQWFAAKYNREAAGRLRIQYGGSVKPANIRDLMTMPDVDGALVGGASLKVEDFCAIVLWDKA